MKFEKVKDLTERVMQITSRDETAYDKISDFLKTFEVKQPKKSKAQSAVDRRHKLKERRLFLDGWAPEFLKPGMIVKVKSNASTNIRMVIRNDPGGFVGLHVGCYNTYSRSHENQRQKGIRIVGQSYMTHHGHDKIMRVLVNEQNDPIILEILSLSEKYIFDKVEWKLPWNL